MSLLGELKRRNVFRVGVAYVVAAWLIAQVLQLALTSFAAPEWVMKTILVLLAVGLPFALFFAWAYELTPEGIKREQEVSDTKPVNRGASKRLDRTIIVVLALAVAYFSYDKFLRSPSLDDAGSIAMTSSIAVLPFVNLSSDAEQQYFSDGLSEELLNLLAKIPELRVTSRSSSFSFRDDQIDIPSIAQKLNVLHVLEGSVRKSGSQIRVTAQLIDAQTDKHLWSQTYERTLDDIFAIQDDIALSVVGGLRLVILGDAPTSTAVDPEAYSLYLQARHLGYRNSRDAWEKSNALYEQALELDPGFVAALTGLAANYRQQSGRIIGPMSMGDGFEFARGTAERALALDPGSAEAHAVLGGIAESYDGDLQTAARHFEKAVSLQPTNGDVLLEAVSLTNSLGRNEKGLRILEYLVARDPLNPRAYWRLGYAYEVAERWRDARRAFQQALLLSPDMGVAKMAIGLTLLEQDEPDPEAALASIKEDSNVVWRLVGLVLAHHALGEHEESDAALNELIEDHEENSSYNIAAAYAYRNEADRAFEWLEKAVEYKDPGLSEIIRQAFFFRTLHEDPRWMPLLERIGKAPDQLAAIEFDLQLPE